LIVVFQSPGNPDEDLLGIVNKIGLGSSFFKVIEKFNMLDFQPEMSRQFLLFLFRPTANYNFLTKDFSASHLC
jgi:hypothetical protein